MNIEREKEKVFQNLIVTIDGPAGSGKSTTASLLADRLGLMYLDTGAMYRAVTHAVLQGGIDPEDEESVSIVARTVNLELRITDGKPHLYLDGRKVEREIREAAVSRAVSPVSRYREVRRAMVRIQRSIGRRSGIVADGRDTGSMVFPFAHVKVFLTADVDTRAARRKKQLELMGISQELGEIRENITRRDSIDAGRDYSPLVQPPGAFIIDTANITIEEQVSVIESKVREEAGRLADLMVKRGETCDFGKTRFHYRLARSFLRILFTTLFGLRVYGRDNLRFRENFIFSSNHVSYADPPIVGCTLNREVWFVAKHELFRNRLFAWLIRTYNAIPVDRGEMDRKTLKLIVGKLKDGESIMMFPEGTRSRDGELGNLKPGIGFISMLAGTTIVPIYVTGSNELGRCLIRKKRLEVRIGPPIRIPDDYTPDNKKRDYKVLAGMIVNEIRMLKHDSET